MPGEYLEDLIAEALWENLDCQKAENASIERFQAQKMELLRKFVKSCSISNSARHHTKRSSRVSDNATEHSDESPFTTIYKSRRGENENYDQDDFQTPVAEHEERILVGTDNKIPVGLWISGLAGMGKSLLIYTRPLNQSPSGL